MPADGSPEGLTAQAAALIGLVGPLGVSSPNLIGAVPCVFRGHMIRRFVQDGRAVVIDVVGCELIEGIRMNGVGRLDLRSMGPVQSHGDLVGSKFTGVLDVEGPGWSRSVPGFELLELDVVPTGERPLVSDVESVDLTFGEGDWRVADPALFDRPEDTADRSLNGLGSSTLEALSTVDTDRLAVDFGGQMAAFFLNELTETLRGDHTHTNECGTIHVTPDSTVNTSFTVDWSACRLAGGMVVEGQFQVVGLPPFETRFAWTMAGAVHLGGSVPRVLIEGMDWAVTFPPEGPGEWVQVQLDVELRSGTTKTGVSRPAYWGT